LLAGIVTNSILQIELLRVVLMLNDRYIIFFNIVMAVRRKAVNIEKGLFSLGTNPSLLHTTTSFNIKIIRNLFYSKNRFRYVQLSNKRSSSIEET